MLFNGSDINATGLGTWFQNKAITSGDAGSQIRHKCHNFQTFSLVLQAQFISRITERLVF
jgi:hypothetical protein